MKRLAEINLIFLILFTLGCSPSKEIKGLIITGGHGYEEEEFYEMFDSFDHFVYDKANHPGANEYYAGDKSDRYDVFIFYDMNQDITPEQQQQFIDMVNKGKGLVFLHHSLADYQQWGEFLNIIGGRYFLQDTLLNGSPVAKSTFKHDVEMNVSVVADHPVTEGLDDFTIHDEAYGGFYVAPTVTPLLKTDHPQSSETIAWINNYGNSRIVTIQLGHDHFAYENPNYRRLVHNAIKWAAE